MTAIQMVRVTQLREHELQEKLSPWMCEARWRSWFDNVARDGILYPIYALPDGRVFNGKHRLRAARELGLAEIAVIYEDLTNEQVAARIIADKLEHDTLTIGQRVCIEINRAEAEGLFAEAEQRMDEGRVKGGLIKNGCSVNLGSQSTNPKTRDLIASRIGISVKPVQQRNFPGVRALLQRKGKKDVDLYFAFKDASLTESALCAFIAGIDMRDDTRIATEVALVQRFSRENKRFDATMKALGVDVRDPLAIKQAGEFVNFRDYIIEAWRDVPYFQRREPFITELIDQADRVSYDVSDGLIKPSLRDKHKDDNALELKRAATREFSEGFIAHLINTLGLDFHKIAEKVERYETMH
jgi:ParB-like nuclease domain